MKNIFKNIQTDSIEFRDEGCQYCMSGRIKSSYHDGDNMTAFIHEDKPNKNDYKSLAYWLTVNCHDESQEFYIEFCPWCGKRLVPFNPDDCNQKSCD